MRTTRRRLIGLLGAGAVASGAAIGSGAFTRSEVDRSFDLQIAADDAALLALEPNEGQRNGVSSVVDANPAIAEFASARPQGNVVAFGDEDPSQTLETYTGDPGDYLAEVDGVLELQLDELPEADGLNARGITVFQDLVVVTNQTERELAFAADIQGDGAGTLDLLMYEEQSAGMGRTVSFVEAADWTVTLESGSSAGITVVYDSADVDEAPNGQITIRADRDEV